MLVHHRVTPSIKFASTHLYTWVVRGTARVKCLAHEHNTMSPARPRARTSQSGVECTINHEATAPPTKSKIENNYYKNNYILDSSTMNKSTISEDIVHKFANCGNEAENY